MRIQDFDDPAYDPFVAEEAAFGLIADVHTPLAVLRHRAPLVEGAYMALMGYPFPRDDVVAEWTVLSYAHVVEVLSDAARFSNSAFADSLGKTFGATISAMDAPEHTRYRRVLQKAFLPQNVAKWGDQMVGPVIDALIDRFARRGQADLIGEFTQRYPFEVIYRQLNLPDGDGPIFHKLAVAQGMAYTAQGREASRKLGNYFSALVAERRALPRDDLASALVTAEVDGEYLPDEVIISFLRQLINAAGDTTFRGTSVLLTGLMQNPAQWAALRDDRNLLPSAIDEALRWESPVSFTVRDVRADTELAGVPLKKGTRLYPVISSANRDERVFNNPDRFDIFRKKPALNARSIAFALGPHICLGQHLARLEMTRAMNALLDRLPGMALDSAKEPPVIRGALLRYPKHLHVKFTAR